MALDLEAGDQPSSAGQPVHPARYFAGGGQARLAGSIGNICEIELLL